MKPPPARRATTQIYALRKNAGHRQHAVAILDKHGSRKRPPGKCARKPGSTPDLFT